MIITLIQRNNTAADVSVCNHIYLNSELRYRWPVIDPCYNNLDYMQKIVISLGHVLFEADSISNTGYLSSKFNIKESLMH